MKQKVIRLTLSVLGLLWLIGCGSAEPTPEPAPTAAPAAESSELPQTETITILAFGDSITEGFGVDPQDSYPAQLARRLEADGFENVEVVNGGISGETSTGGLTRVDWMLNTEPDIVIVTTGGNDGLRAIDLDLTRANIDEIVRKFQEGGAIVVIGGMQIIENLGPEYTEEFAQIYPDVASKYETLLIPFFLEGVAADPDLNQPDFIHPTAEGYTVVVDNMYPYILEAIEAAEN